MAAEQEIQHADREFWFFVLGYECSSDLVNNHKVVSGASLGDCRNLSLPTPTISVAC